MEIVYAIVGLLAGGGLGSFIVYSSQTSKNKKQANQLVKEAETKAEVLIKEAELKARENFIKQKEKFESEWNQKNQQAIQAENRIKQKEQSLNQKLENLSRKEKEHDQVKENLNNQLEIVAKKKRRSG